MQISALKGDGTECDDYPGPATINIDYEDPSESQDGVLTTESLDSGWANGILQVTQKYDKWGTVSFTVKDDSLVTQTGTSEEITFLPKSFKLELSDPPESRSYYYLGEEFTLTVTAQDQNDATVGNYGGTVSFGGAEFALPEPYAFTSEDSGAHGFAISGAQEASEGKVSATDSAHNTLTAESDEIAIEQGYIKVLDNRGPIGSMALTVLITDSDGNIMTEDDSTIFTLSLDEFTGNIWNYIEQRCGYKFI